MRCSHQCGLGRLGWSLQLPNAPIARARFLCCRTLVDSGYPLLTPELRRRVLSFLGYYPGRRGLRELNRLVHAYVRSVPWESAFRIAKHNATARIEQRPRWPEEFWTDALERGGGGTCFESNYAFAALLRTLGYDLYLTVNNMEESVGCHTASVVTLGDRRYLVDVGIPLHRAIRLNRTRPHRSVDPFHTYFSTPAADGVFTIERNHYPKRYIFTLIDRPVTDADYRAATQADYGSSGLFLDAVIIRKVIDGKVWRFNGRERPYRLESFDAHSKAHYPLSEGELAPQLAAFFGMDESVLARSLAITGA